jgi:hypothetical protein
MNKERYGNFAPPKGNVKVMYLFRSFNVFYLFIAPIYWRGRVYFLNRYGGSNLQDEYSIIGCLHDIAYLKRQLAAPILMAQL